MVIFPFQIFKEALRKKRVHARNVTFHILHPQLENNMGVTPETSLNVATADREAVSISSMPAEFVGTPVGEGGIFFQFLR